jgi:hypothetical protein
MKKNPMFFCVWVLAAALVLSAAPSFADDASDVQDALNKAGFGQNVNDANALPTRTQDPNAPGGQRYSDQGNQPPASSPSGYTAGLEYNFHTYMNLGELKYGFKVADNETPLPKPESATDYYYPQRLNFVPGQILIGRPPAASDPGMRWPSEPFGDPYASRSVRGSILRTLTGRNAMTCKVSWVFLIPSRPFRMNSECPLWNSATAANKGG